MGVAGVLFVAGNLHSDVFASGDLADKLPAGDYVLSDGLSDVVIGNIAFAWGAATYRFDRYKKDERALPRLGLASEPLLEQARQRVAAIRLVRDLVNTPAADMMPEHMSDVARHVHLFCSDQNDTSQPPRQTQ